MFYINYTENTDDGNGKQLKLNFYKSIASTKDYYIISRGDRFGTVIVNNINTISKVQEKDVSALSDQDKLLIASNPEIGPFIVNALAAMYYELDENGKKVQNEDTANKALESDWINEIADISALKNILNEVSYSMFK